MNHRGGTVSLVDAQERKVVGTISVGGELEFAAAAGDGRVFVNVANKHQIAVIDVPAKKVTSKFTLAACTDPSGLAHDSADQIPIGVCGNGVALISPAKLAPRAPHDGGHPIHDLLLTCRRNLCSYVPQDN